MGPFLYSRQPKQVFKDRPLFFLLISTGEESSQSSKHANKIITLIFCKATILDTLGIKKWSVLLNAILDQVYKLLDNDKRNSVPSGLNFINALRTAFTREDPKSVKIQLSCQYLFTLLGSTTN